MDGLKYFTAIVPREKEPSYIEFLKEYGVKYVLSQFCEGTATDSILSFLGLEKAEKSIIKCMVRDEDEKDLKYSLLTKTELGTSGGGIAFFIPIDGIGGVSAKNALVGEEPIKKENVKMDKNTGCVLIITIVEAGNTDVVMDAAREKGATGGTVVKAFGTGAEIAKFFGVVISDEKEMVYIVCKREQRDDIMHAIMEKAGVNTSSHGITFSLPVDSVLGIREFENL